MLSAQQNELMAGFWSETPGRPLAGRCGQPVAQSEELDVAWHRFCSADVILAPDLATCKVLWAPHGRLIQYIAYFKNARALDPWASADTQSEQRGHFEIF